MPQPPLRPGQILTDILFNEPMRVETIRDTDPDTWVVGLVGTATERFRSVTLTFEDRLYRDVTHFVKHQSAKAAAKGDDPRARAVGFLMALYQRRLASSTYALRHSLANRASQLGDGLKCARVIVQPAPPDLPDLGELGEMEEQERERLEEMLTAITLAGNADQIREKLANCSDSPLRCRPSSACRVC